MESTIKNVIRALDEFFGLAAGVLNQKYWLEKYYTLSIKLGLIMHDIIPDDLFVELDAGDIESIKTKLNLNCYPLNKKITFITKGGPPDNKKKSELLKPKNTRLILDFYSQEMLFPNHVTKRGVWEISIREENFPLNISDKEIIEKLNPLIDAINNMEFPKSRPKYFILERILTENNIKRTKIKKFNGFFTHVKRELVQ